MSADPDSFEAASPVEWRTHTLSTGHRMASRVQGAGPTLVQVHGLGTGHANYDLLSPHLAGWFRVVDIDLPGYGASDAPTEPRSIEAYADHVADFLRSAGLAPAFVHGTSMGGAIILAMAARHPDVVRRMVVSCSFGRADRAALQMRRTWRQAADADPSGAMLAELTAQHGFSREFWDRPEAASTLAAFTAAMSSTSPDEFLKDMVTIDVVDLEPIVDQITTPVLLLAADEDLICPVEAAESGIGMAQLHERIAASELAIIDRCGHYVSIESPKATAAHIAKFILRSNQP